MRRTLERLLSPAGIWTRSGLPTLPVPTTFGAAILRVYVVLLPSTAVSTGFVTATVGLWRAVMVHDAMPAQVMPPQPPTAITE